MAVVINAKGTSVSQFQIGKQGPIIKNNSGVIEFKDSTDTDLQVQILSTANAVNNLTLTGSTTGNDATIAVVGTDTNVNIKIEPKGTGEVILGPTGAASSSLQAEDDQDLFVLGGDSAAAAAGDLVLQGGDGTGGFASGNVEIRGGTGGSGSGTVIIDSTEFALPSGGGITVGSPTGGNQGSGTINATAFYENGAQLTSPQVTFDSDTFTGDGSTTGFSLSRAPVSTDAILVAVSGLLQDGGVDFTVSGTTLTFTTAPPNSAKILVLYRDVLSTLTETRNVIINGNFDIWQRGTSFTAPASTNYSTDRFLWGFSGTGVVDILQSTSVPDNTSEFSLQVDVTTADTSIAAGDNYAIQTRIEGYDLQRFGFGSSDATSLTLSFWVLSSKTGIHCISLKNNDSTRSFIIEYTVNVADTWEYKTNTLTADTTGTWLADNGTGIKIIFNLAAGSTFHTTAGSWTAGNFLSSSNQVNVMDSTSNNFHLSRVQLEVGSVATAFERRSFAQEFSMAQRYYQEVAADAVKLLVYQHVSSQNRHALLFPVTMRVAPTMTTNFTSLSNTASVTTDAIHVAGFSIQSNATTTPQNTTFTMDYTADAEL